MTNEIIKHDRRRNLFGFEVFDSIFKDIDSFFNDFDPLYVKELYSCSFPPVNIIINKKTKDLIFEFALSGYNENDISLSFDGDKMFLELSKVEKNNLEDFQYIQRGIKLSSQKQYYFVPSAKYNVDKAEATMKNGILTVTIPAKDEAKPKKVEVKLIS